MIKWNQRNPYINRVNQFDVETSAIEISKNMWHTVELETPHSNCNIEHLPGIFILIYPYLCHGNII